MIKRILAILLVLSALNTSTTTFANDKIETAISNLNSSGSAERALAITTLINNRSERATEGLIAALNNSDESISKLALKELGYRAQKCKNNARAIEGLISGLDKDNITLKTLAVESLAAVNLPRSTEGLIRAMDISNESIQKIAIKALITRMNTSERAIEGVIRALDLYNTNIRLIAVNALAKSSNKRAKEGLRRALNDSNKQIRAIAKKYTK